MNINLVEEDEAVIIDPIQIEPYKQVETPPLPPSTGFDETDKIVIDYIDVPGDRDVFQKPDIDIMVSADIHAEQDYQPLVRVPPAMPTRAERSGYCEMRFDVSGEGKPFNVQAVYCSESVFERASIKAVQKWNYRPRREGGLAITVNDIETRIAFDLRDANGKSIPAKG